jgi:hypothetical protein
LEWFEKDEKIITDNIKKGNICKAKDHARNLVEFYVTDNPFRPNQDKWDGRERLNMSQEELHELYEIKNRVAYARKKGYYVGIAIQKLVDLL